ncbi:MAG: uL22 family ribosomal protein [Patescibacteria group bacterium]
MATKVKTIKKRQLVEVNSEVKFIPTSPHKLRLVAALVRNLPPKLAIRKLKFLDKRGGSILAKALKSGIANATNNFNLDPESLKLAKVLVNEGPRSKRQDRSHGARFNSGIIQKKRTHLLITLSGLKRENGQEN